MVGCLNRNSVLSKEVVSDLILHLYEKAFKSSWSLYEMVLASFLTKDPRTQASDGLNLLKLVVSRRESLVGCWIQIVS